MRWPAVVLAGRAVPQVTWPWSSTVRMARTAHTALMGLTGPMPRTAPMRLTARTDLMAPMVPMVPMALMGRGRRIPYQTAGDWLGTKRPGRAQEEREG